MKKSKISKNVSKYYYALENDNIIIDVTMNYAQDENSNKFWAIICIDGCRANTGVHNDCEFQT